MLNNEINLEILPRTKIRKLTINTIEIIKNPFISTPLSVKLRPELEKTIINKIKMRNKVMIKGPINFFHALSFLLCPEISLLIKK